MNPLERQMKPCPECNGEAEASPGPGMEPVLVPCNTCFSRRLVPESYEEAFKRVVKMCKELADMPDCGHSEPCKSITCADCRINAAYKETKEKP